MQRSNSSQARCGSPVSSSNAPRLSGVASTPGPSSVRSKIASASSISRWPSARSPAESASMPIPLSVVAMSRGSRAARRRASASSK